MREEGGIAYIWQHHPLGLLNRSIYHCLLPDYKCSVTSCLMLPLLCLLCHDCLFVPTTRYVGTATREEPSTLPAHPLSSRGPPHKYPNSSWAYLRLEGGWHCPVAQRLGSLKVKDELG